MCNSRRSTLAIVRPSATAAAWHRIEIRATGAGLWRCYFAAWAVAGSTATRPELERSFNVPTRSKLPRSLAQTRDVVVRGGSCLFLFESADNPIAE